jgi:hypothetical protein
MYNSQDRAKATVDSHRWGDDVLISTAPPARARTNHAFHLVMTIVTLGVWLLVWIIVAIVKRGK